MPFIRLQKQKWKQLCIQCTRGVTELKNRFVGECSLSESLFHLVMLRSFLPRNKRAGPCCFSSVSSPRWHSGLFDEKKNICQLLMWTEKPGASFKRATGMHAASPREAALCSLLNTSTSPSCPGAVLTEEEAKGQCFWAALMHTYVCNQARWLKGISERLTGNE